MFSPWAYLWAQARRVGDELSKLADEFAAMRQQINDRHEGADDPKPVAADEPRNRLANGKPARAK